MTNDAGQPQPLPSGWKWARLGELARINPPRAPHIPHSPGMSTTFVPMASVSEDSGTIAWPETRTWSEVSKGYTYFEAKGREIEAALASLKSLKSLL